MCTAKSGDFGAALVKVSAMEEVELTRYGAQSVVGILRRAGLVKASVSSVSTQGRVQRLFYALA